MRHNAMRIARLFAVLGLALSFLVLAPSASYACSCAGLSTDEHVDNADVVVRGTIDARDESLIARMRGGGPVTYSVTVEEVYKGSAGRALEVKSSGSGASCGLELISYGEEYVVFAGTGQSGGLWASLCGGTSAATPELVEEVRALTGPPSAPEARAAPSGEEAVWPWAVGLLATGAGLGTFLRRRLG